jgi:hypothetical protein
MNLRGKACVVCGQVFLPGSGSQLTCSAECKTELRAIRKGKKASDADRLRGVGARNPSRGTPEEAGLAGMGEELELSDPLEPMVTYIRSVARIVIRKEVGKVLREIFEVEGQRRRK